MDALNLLFYRGMCGNQCNYTQQGNYIISRSYKETAYFKLKIMHGSSLILKRKRTNFFFKYSD